MRKAPAGTGSLSGFPSLRVLPRNRPEISALTNAGNGTPSILIPGMWPRCVHILHIQIHLKKKNADLYFYQKPPKFGLDLKACSNKMLNPNSLNYRSMHKHRRDLKTSIVVIARFDRCPSEKMRQLSKREAIFPRHYPLPSEHTGHSSYIDSAFKLHTGLSWHYHFK